MPFYTVKELQHHYSDQGIWVDIISVFAKDKKEAERKALKSIKLIVVEEKTN